MEKIPLVWHCAIENSEITTWKVLEGVVMTKLRE